MTTGFARPRELVAHGGLRTPTSPTCARRHQLRSRDIIAGKHDSTLLRTPFELLARERGFDVLATAESLGAYQGTVACRALGAAAKQNEAALVSFIRAYQAGVALALRSRQPRDRRSVLVANIRDMTPALARRASTSLLASKGGFAQDGAFDVDGHSHGARDALEVRAAAEDADRSGELRRRHLPARRGALLKRSWP